MLKSSSGATATACATYRATSARSRRRSPISLSGELPQGFERFGAFQLKAQSPIRVLYVLESPLCAMKFAQMGPAGGVPVRRLRHTPQVEILRELGEGRRLPS
jgi:hypothetical protein